MKILFSILMSIIIFLAISSPVSAQFDPFADVCSGDGSTSATCLDKKKDQLPGGNSLYGPGSVFSKVTNLLSFVIGISAVIGIILGGFKLISSSGDPQQVSGARRTIIFSLVGVAVVLFAQTMIYFVLDKL